jgi:hypothetical protein
MHKTVRAKIGERERLERAMGVSVHQDLTAQVFVAIRAGKHPRGRKAMAVQWITSRLPVELQLMICSMVATGITQQGLDTTTPRLAVVLEGARAKYIRDGRAWIPNLSGAIAPCRPQHMRGPSDATIRYYERAVRLTRPMKDSIRRKPVGAGAGAGAGVGAGAGAGPGPGLALTLALAQAHYH